MRLWRAIPVLLLAMLVTLAGCKKKPKAAPPPQAQAPTVEQPQPQLPPTQPTQPPAQTQPAQPSTTTTTAAPPSTVKPKPKHNKKTTAKNTPPQPPPKSNKTVVENGSTGEGGQLSAAIPHDEAIHQRFSTAQLLEATETNLKSITRTLTNDEQEMVRQIRSFVQQSRLATSNGDTESAYNLAFKAHLLSEELVKPK